jgi:triosephosphate isomerase
MRRQPLVAGNWKMHLDHHQAARLAREVVAACSASLVGETAAAVVVAPSFTSLQGVAAELAGSTVALAAQNVSAEAEGAHTGEVALAMLAALGVGWVILGHSERRQLYGERDAEIARKLRSVLDDGLAAIVCVGETLRERESGAAETVVATQLDGAFSDFGEGAALLAERVCVAYEPVWAIGTGRTATPQDAGAMHRSIRAWASARFDANAADSLRILYGGSVKPENAPALLGDPDIDGALVGGASLEAASFAKIVAAAGVADAE